MEVSKLQVILKGQITQNWKMCITKQSPLVSVVFFFHTMEVKGDRKLFGYANSLCSVCLSVYLSIYHFVALNILEEIAKRFFFRIL